jgi:hypothetical protein
MKIPISIFALLLFGTINSQDNDTLPLHIINGGNYSYLEWDTNLDHVMEEVPHRFKVILQSIKDRKPFLPSEGCNFSGEGVILQGKNVGDLQRAEVNHIVYPEVSKYICSQDDKDSRIIQRFYDVKSLLYYFAEQEEPGPVILTPDELYVVLYGTYPARESLDKNSESRMRIELAECFDRIDEKVKNHGPVITTKSSCDSERFLDIIEAIEHGKPFIPAEGCYYSGNGMSADGENIGEFQRSSVKKSAGMLMPGATIIYACSHDDPDSKIIQRFLDVITLLTRFTPEDIDGNINIDFTGPILYTIIHGSLPSSEEVFDLDRKELLTQSLRKSVKRITEVAFLPQNLNKPVKIGALP